MKTDSTSTARRPKSARTKRVRIRLNNRPPTAAQLYAAARVLAFPRIAESVKLRNELHEVACGLTEVVSFDADLKARAEAMLAAWVQFDECASDLVLALHWFAQGSDVKS